MRHAYPARPAFFLCVLFIAITSAHAGSDAWPAARRHVKFTEGRPYRFESRLKRVVELNFTFGNGHLDGKLAVDAALQRIVTRYGGPGPDSLSLTRIATHNSGSIRGESPAFTLGDLLSGEVLVANNIGYLDGGELGATMQDALRQAIEVHGRGYLGFHGSGEGSSGAWKWYSNTLFPLVYKGHTLRTAVPIYKHLPESGHMVLENVLAEKARIAETVPDELDAEGNERYAHGVPVRDIKHEFFRFGRDITRDSAYRDKVTPLLKMDCRFVGSDAMPEQYRRKGGNLYSFLYKVGNAYTAYIPAGHENDEVLAPATGFDGGVGDFDRYVAQLLFFMAGYDSTACDALCEGLPIVDGNNRLTGSHMNSTSAKEIRDAGFRFDPGRIGFSAAGEGNYQVTLRSVSGRPALRSEHAGPVSLRWDPATLPAGILILEVRRDRGPMRAKRYSNIR